jgi:glycosyltransferase involved in cell wall biosynthesis
MKRVAFFMPSFRGGGAERVMVTLSEALADLGMAVDLVVAQAEGPNRPRARRPGLRIVDLAAARVIAGLPALVRYLREARPDAMLSALPHCNVIAIWARAISGIPTRLVLSEHTIASLSAANARLRRSRVLPAFMRLSYRHADAVVAVSDGVADDLASLVGMDRSAITRIYNPVVTPRLVRLAEEQPDHAWFAPGQPPVILGVGRLTAAKDFRTLVEAFAALRARRAARLLILGEGEERQALESLARTLDVARDVSMPGFADNPFMYMKRSAVFVVSSRWEGFCNALVEAMACGTPVVSTRCDGPREILEDGRHGKLADIGDPAALAHAIEAQLDGASEGSALARAQVFTADAAVRAYRGLLAV